MNKKLLCTIAAVLAFLSLSVPAQAGKGGFVQYAYGPHVTHVAELPADIRSAMGSSDFKLGFRHERTELYWMPVWGTTEGNYVFYQESGDGWRSLPVPAEILPELSSALNMDLTSGSPISFVSIMWGWLVYGPLALILLMSVLVKKGAKDEQESYQAVYADPIDAAVQQRAQAQYQAAPANRMQADGPPVFGKRR